MKPRPLGSAILAKAVSEALFMPTNVRRRRPDTALQALTLKIKKKV